MIMELQLFQELFVMSNLPCGRNPVLFIAQLSSHCPLPPSGGGAQFLRCSWSFRRCFSFCFSSLSRAFFSFSAAL